VRSFLNGKIVRRTFGDFSQTAFFDMVFVISIGRRLLIRRA
jgi:hypothetical protein